MKTLPADGSITPSSWMRNVLIVLIVDIRLDQDLVTDTVRVDSPSEVAVRVLLEVEMTGQSSARHQVRPRSQPLDREPGLVSNLKQGRLLLPTQPLLSGLTRISKLEEEKIFSC